MAPVEAVIAGIGGAFPQSDGLEHFIDNLLAGKNLSSVDDLRWKPGLLGTSPHVGKISNVHRFDNNLFKVHRPLARLMDPLARLMLERSMEAVLDAGLAPEDIANTYTSVYMTTTVSESESRTTSLLHSKKAAGYAIMAGSKTMMSNRISYCLNLNGPSVTLDGDWTVGLVAMQRAARSIEIGESDYALIGAANTCLFPELNKIYENLGVLSSDGQCRALDATASGCFRAEGAVVFLLQRADKANRIYARLGGIHEVCMGSRSRFVGVDALALTPVIEGLYREAGVDAADVALLTADGISIPEIERDEMQASAAALCRSRKGLPVSAAKAVAGHGDAVGALISVIHAITAMERGVIPALPHFSRPHPDAKALADGRLQVVTSPQPVQLGERSVMAVNTLGYSGCIAHSILRPHNKVKQPPSADSERYPRLVIVSGRTEEDAVRVANQIIDKPFDPEFLRLTQQAFSKPIIGYKGRATTVLPSDEEGFRPLIACKSSDSKNRPVWFVYSGMGSQWAGMGCGLMRLPAFAETIQRLQPVLEPEGIDLIHTLTTEDASLFENIVYSFISIAAIQIGLTNLMRLLGVEPAGIVGHSTGELGCAYGDGCLSEEETLRAAYARGKASLAVNLEQGMMASIGMSWQEAQAQVPASVDVACHNSADNCTISGPTDDVTAFVEKLQQKNVFARMVNVSNIAFHSRYVRPAGSFLQKYLLEVLKAPKKRSPRWVASSINPGDEDKPALALAGPEFFTNNLLSPVRFEAAMRAVPAGAVVVELAPHGLMQPLIRRGLPEGATTIGLTRRGHRDGLRFLLENVGKLFMEGVAVKPWVLAPEVPLPVSRGTPCLNTLSSWDHREEWPLVINTRSQTSRPRSVPLYPDTTPCITQAGKRCATPSAFLEIVWREVADDKALETCPVVFNELEFTTAVEMQAQENMELELQLQRETGLFEMAIAADDWESAVCVMRGRVRVLDPAQDADDADELAGLESACGADADGLVLEAEDVYANLQDHDLKYDEALTSLRQVKFSAAETTGQCEWRGRWHRLLDGLFQLAALADSQPSVFCCKIRRVVIAPLQMKAVARALPVRHVLATGVLAAPGVNVEGYRRAEPPREAFMSMLDLGVQPLQQHTAQDESEFIRSVALMRVQNSDTQHAFSVLVLEQERDDVAARLQEALREAVGVQVAVRRLSVVPGKPVPAEAEGAAVLVTDFRSGQAGRVLAHLQRAAPGVTPMVLRCGVRGGHDGFVAVTSTLSAEPTLSLLVPRRQDSAEDAAPAARAVRVVHVQRDEAVPAELQVADDGEVILVWRGPPREGVLGAAATVRARPFGDRARLVVILDADAPEFSLRASIYRDRLALGLMVNVLQGGRWGELQLSAFNDVPVVPIATEGFRTSFLGLNPKDLGENPVPALGAFDFCGVREGDGRRAMGLARLARHSATGPVAKPDQLLQWAVPAAWTDEEAASVPVAYAVAYHVLAVLARVEAGMQVLIMNGASPVGRACIRVALAAGCRVLTTAASERQRAEAIALNPQVPPDCVFRHDKATIKYYLMKATAHKGVDVALVSSAPLADAVNDCISYRGQTFIMSKANALSLRMGLKVLLKSSSVYGAGPEALLTCTRRDKLAVRDALQRGLDAGAVKPLSANAVDRAEDIDLAALQASTKLLLRLRDGGAGPAAAVRAAGNGNGNGNGNGGRGVGVAFAVAGGRADSLVSMARAAAAKGSRIALAANRDCPAGAPATPARARGVPALRQTTFVPFPKGRSDAAQFLSLASKADNVKAIVINVEDAADRALTSLLQAVLPTLNGALKGVRLLVLTESLTLGTEAVEAWRRMGLAACAVVGEPRLVGRVLPALLTVADLPAAVLAYQRGTDCRVVLGAPSARQSRADTAERPRTSGRPFLEVPSLAPRLRTRHHRLEPLPLFAVTGPALPPRLVQEAAASLLSPVLIADGEHHSADQLAEEMLRLQPRGPWALLGDADRAPLLLGATALLEKKAGRPHWREVVHLALVEGGGQDAVLGDATPNGPLHLIRKYEGLTAKEAKLNKDKSRHFVANTKHISTVLNEHLLSPLSKIISC